MPTKQSSSTIARNRRAGYEYTLEKRFQAGLALKGWELKSIRAGQVQITDSYVSVRQGEAFLVGAKITPLSSASTHVNAVPNRIRKLLLHEREIREINQATAIQGKSCVATSLFWQKSYVKVEVVIATGKRKYDKRQAIRDRDLNRQQHRDAMAEKRN